jgi:integrase
MGKSKPGRKRGGRPRGYYFTKGRGWFALDGRRGVPLCWPDGRHIMEKNTPQEAILQAYRRWKTAKAAQVAAAEAARQAAAAKQGPSDPQAGPTMEEVCQRYLRHVLSPGTAAAQKTFYSRANSLFDFCYALPACCRPKDPRGTPPTAAEIEQLRKKHACQHPAYARRLASSLTQADVNDWLQAHPTWHNGGGRRFQVQALKAALNHALREGKLRENPIAKYKAGKSLGCITYFTAEQEAALLKHAHPALRTALAVCIRTGMRYGIEFVPLTARQVTDLGDRMELEVTSKTTKAAPKGRRLVRVRDEATLALIRQQIKEHPRGPIFRNESGGPWQADNLTVAFTRLRRRVERLEGLQFDTDTRMNTCRHTYAKRCLEGYWSGKPITLQTLAQLMGNTVQVCIDHYLRWCKSEDQRLWEAC